MGRPSTMLARRRLLDELVPVLESIIERNNAEARILPGLIGHDVLTLDDFTASMNPISSSAYRALTLWVGDVFHAKRVARSDSTLSRAAFPVPALIPGFTPSPQLAPPAPEPGSSETEQAQSLARLSALQSPVFHASFPPAAHRSDARGSYQQPDPDAAASGDQSGERGVGAPARAEVPRQLIIEDARGRRVMNPHHCPAQDAPCLDRWRETWPSVPHWGCWPSVRTHLSGLGRPVHDVLLPPREVVRKYQLTLLEKLSRIFDDAVEARGGVPAILSTHHDVGSRIVTLRHDIYQARQVLGRAVMHTDFRANIIISSQDSMTVGHMPRSPLAPGAGYTGPLGVYAAEPLDQMKADLVLLEHFNDLKDRLLACTDRLSHSLPRMDMACSAARRAATEHANRIRQERGGDVSLLLPREINLDLADLHESGPCMIRYEGDDRMPMVRVLPYVRRPNSILGPQHTESPRLRRLLRGRAGLPAFDQPTPGAAGDLAPLVPFPRVAMSPPLATFWPDLPNDWFGPYAQAAHAWDPPEDRLADPRSPRPRAALDRGANARRLASQLALRRSSSRVSPREQYLSHAIGEFDAFSVRRRADTREQSPPEGAEMPPRPRRYATPHRASNSAGSHETTASRQGRRIAPLPRRAL